MAFTLTAIEKKQSACGYESVVVTFDGRAYLTVENAPVGLPVSSAWPR